MTKFLQPKFTIGYTSKEYKKGWEATFEETAKRKIAHAINEHLVANDNEMAYVKLLHILDTEDYNVNLAMEVITNMKDEQFLTIDFGSTIKLTNTYIEELE